MGNSHACGRRELTVVRMRGFKFSLEKLDFLLSHILEK